jgi:3-isopropylmalate dehydrogenase
MLLRFSAGQPALANRIEQAVATLLADGARTQDLAAVGEVAIGTQEMTARLLKLL